MAAATSVNSTRWHAVVRTACRSGRKARVGQHLDDREEGIEVPRRVEDKKFAEPLWVVVLQNVEYFT
jgi:hypothetical protein